MVQTSVLLRDQDEKYRDLRPERQHFWYYFGLERGVRSILCTHANVTKPVGNVADYEHKSAKCSAAKIGCNLYAVTYYDTRRHSIHDILNFFDY